MISGRQLSVGDYLAILRRRVWLIVIPAILSPLVALLIARQLSPKYTSNSLILIEQPKVPATIVPSVVGDDLIARLANMEEQILSRTRLQPLIERYGLYKSDWNKVPMEALVAEMRDDILVKPVSFANQPGATPGENGNQLPGFEISFTAPNPDIAQAICNEITSMFIDENLRLREQRAEGTATFIQTQLQQAKQKLDEQDARLAAFKRQYFGSLPDQEQSTIQILGTLTGQLNSLTDAMGRYQDDRTYTESLLTQQVTAWKAAQTGSNPQTLQEQLSTLENHLMDLKMRYTDDYPDVVKAKRDIASLKKEIAQQATKEKASNGSKTAEKAPTGASEPNSITQLHAQLFAIQEGMEENQRDQKRVHQQIASYEARLKMTPAVEQQYKDITRNYQTALDFYNNLLSKEDISQMSSSLEQRQEGQQFVILDPADRPVKPSYPDKMRFAGGGLVVGLLIGFAVALLLEMRDKALQDERDVEFFLGVPTLAMIPEVGRSNGGKKRFLPFWKETQKDEAASSRVG